jgi:hypothetical protein
LNTQPNARSISRVSSIRRRIVRLQQHGRERRRQRQRVDRAEISVEIAIVTANWR